MAAAALLATRLLVLSCVLLLPSSSAPRVDDDDDGSLGESGTANDVDTTLLRDAVVVVVVIVVVVVVRWAGKEHTDRPLEIRRERPLEALPFFPTMRVVEVDVLARSLSKKDANDGVFAFDLTAQGETGRGGMTVGSLALMRFPPDKSYAINCSKASSAESSSWQLKDVSVQDRSAETRFGATAVGVSDAPRPSSEWSSPPKGPCARRLLAARCNRFLNVGMVV